MLIKWKKHQHLFLIRPDKFFEWFYRGRMSLSSNCYCIKKLRSLQLGLRGSEARHMTTAQYYRDLIRQMSELEANVQQLQTELQQAEQQLDEVGTEIKSEKLDAVKMEAKAAFVAKVGSLFGSGKLKVFEHRNEDLQSRMQELEEVLLREEQYSKQIQEMKKAYEQQYRKLSEFTDFFKRYFPYVDKLIQVIKFLREIQNFGDVLIKKLCMLKILPLKANSILLSSGSTLRQMVRFVRLKKSQMENLNST